MLVVCDRHYIEMFVFKKNGKIMSIKVHIFDIKLIFSGKFFCQSVFLYLEL